MKKALWFAVLLVMLAGVSRMITGTVDTPSVATWVDGSFGSFYVTNGPAAVSSQSQLLNGSCFASVASANLYNAIGPLTPPTLPAAPWHLEAR